MALDHLSICKQFVQAHIRHAKERRYFPGQLGRLPNLAQTAIALSIGVPHIDVYRYGFTRTLSAAFQNGMRFKASSVSCKAKASGKFLAP